MKFEVNPRVPGTKVHFRGMAFAKGVIHDTAPLKKSLEWEQALLNVELGGVKFFIQAAAAIGAENKEADNG